MASTASVRADRREGVLPRISAFIEELLLVRLHRPAEDRIAMWKAAEAQHDAVMPPRMGNVRLAQTEIEHNRAFLIGDNFRMPERQIEEQAQFGWEPLIVIDIHGGRGDLPRGRIGGVHARRPPESVAGELIQ